MKAGNIFASALVCLLLVSSCKGQMFNPEKPDLIDPSMNLERKDYQNMLTPEGEKMGDAGVPLVNAKTGNVIEPPIPDIAEIMAAPKPPKIADTQLVSLAVTDDVPLKDVLIELARLANVDIEIDSGITGGISFRAKDRPFNEVIDRVADLAGLRYSIKNNIMRVERDTPYVEIYSLDFLNLDRSSQSNVNISTSVLASNDVGGLGNGNGSSGGNVGGSGGNVGGGAGGGGGGAAGGGAGGANGGAGAGRGFFNGSTSNVTSKAESDFWKQFEESVKRILSYKEVKRISSANISDQPDSPVAAVAAQAAGAGGSGALGNLPPLAPNGSAKEESSTDPIAGSFFIINREASTMTVSATEKQHTLIKHFLKKIQTNASAQVLIEAKIVEVNLKDQFQSGIDWNRLGNGTVNFTSSFAGVADKANIATLAAGVEGIGGTGIDLNGAINLAQAFGTTRTLSSPRLHAINNQQAVLTFAQNQVYFTLNVQQNQIAINNGATNTITVNSTPHTVPIGIILALQPSINTETNEVTLSVRPTLSRITGQVTDPAVAFTLAQAASQGIDTTGINSVLPVIEVRELDSILKLKSGQVMVIGGLMEDRAENTDTGVPYAQDVPIFGHVFKGANKNNNMKELVIFIRAVIVNSGGNAAPADKDVYEKFGRDPRPLKF